MSVTDVTCIHFVLTIVKNIQRLQTRKSLQFSSPVQVIALFNAVISFKQVCVKVHNDNLKVMSFENSLFIALYKMALISFLL